MKTFRCEIFGNIKVSDLALTIIDTNEFQRLHGIKQLGFTYKVFPGATHSRFSHSIGVYHLTRRFIEEIEQHQKSDTIPLMERQKELICIAGLIHDLGHGCFSHVFDKYLELKNDDNILLPKKHEDRSCLIFRMMVQKYPLKFTNTEVDHICDLISNPKKDKWYHLIVNNTEFFLDTDKFDYLVRDSHHVGFPVSFDTDRILKNVIVRNNKIYLSKKIEYEVHKLFRQREEMHKVIYRHKTTEKFQTFFLDRLLSSSLSITNLEYFLSLTDDILLYLLFTRDDLIILSTRIFPKNMIEERNHVETEDCQEKTALEKIRWFD
jgi:HD superfamily phosphohydrolase